MGHRSTSGAITSLPAYAGTRLSPFLSFPLSLPLSPDPDADWWRQRRLLGLSLSGSAGPLVLRDGGGGGGRGSVLLLGAGPAVVGPRAGPLRVAAVAGRLPALRRRRALQPLLPPGAQRHPGRDRPRRHQSHRRHLGGHAAGFGAQR